jgi:hypothetical protein
MDHFRNSSQKHFRDEAAGGSGDIGSCYNGAHYGNAVQALLRADALRENLSCVGDVDAADTDSRDSAVACCSES